MNEASHGQGFALETPRLTLREPSAEDLDALAAMYADPEVMRFIGGGGVRDRDTAAAALARASEGFRRDGFGVWSVVRKDTGTMIGRAGLVEWDIEGIREMEVVFLVAGEHWGHGFATEAARAARDDALERLRRTRLICLIYGNNARSKAVARKLGMAFEREVEMFGVVVSMFSMKSSDHAGR